MLPPRWAPDFTQPYFADGENPGVAFPVTESIGLAQRWLDYVHRQPCAITGQRRAIVAHHYGAGSGMGQKCSDFQTVPLTDERHKEFHDTGRIKPFTPEQTRAAFAEWGSTHLAKFLEALNGK